MADIFSLFCAVFLAGADWADAILRAMNGEKNVKICTYGTTSFPFFFSKFRPFLID